MNRWFKLSIFIFLFSFTCLSVSGCAGLRRKFIRQKKSTKKDKFIPVLEPLEYQARYRAPIEDYKKAYGMWRVWKNEMEQMIERGGTETRYKHALNQMIVQCQSMGELLIDDKRNLMEDRIAELYQLLKQYEKPEQMRNRYRIESDMRAHARGVRENLNPDLVVDSMIQLEGS